MHFRLFHSHKLKTDIEHREKLSRQGLDYFQYFFLPSAGPKCFVSAGFEDLLLQQHQEGSISSEKWLIGGSTGALRAFAFVNRSITGRDHTTFLKNHYCSMLYQNGTGAQELHQMMQDAFYVCAPREEMLKSLSHSHFRLGIIVAKVHPCFDHLPYIVLKLILGLIVILNWLTPSALQLFCTRLCFYTGPTPPKNLKTSSGIDFIPLTESNVYQVLHATTCIPFLSKPCRFIEGVGSGLYFDGGLTDFYLNFILDSQHEPGMLLADLEENQAVPRSALDHFVPLAFQRQLPSEYFKHVSYIRPMLLYINSLPDGQLPAVNDWFRQEYIQNPSKRHEKWNSAFHLSKKTWASDFLSQI